MATQQEIIEIQIQMEKLTREIGGLLGHAVKQASAGDWGFCFIIFDFDKEPEGGSLSYISNADRDGMLHMLTSVVARLQQGDLGNRDGQPQTTKPIGGA